MNSQIAFTSHGRKYEVDKWGTIVQVDAKPYVYDAAYSAVYDNPEYVRQSELLQAMRLGFALASHGPHCTRLLDVGYGNGAFLKFANKYVPNVYGYDVTGVDLPDAEIVDGYIKADIYTFWDVLEHYPDLEFLKTVPASTIVVSLPYCHYNSFGQNWFDTQYKHRKPDEHIRHFDQDALINTMDELGWGCIAVSTHEDIVRKSTHGSENILSAAFKRKPKKFI